MQGTQRPGGGLSQNQKLAMGAAALGLGYYFYSQRCGALTGRPGAGAAAGLPSSACFAAGASACLGQQCRACSRAVHSAAAAPPPACAAASTERSGCLQSGDARRCPAAAKPRTLVMRPAGRAPPQARSWRPPAVRCALAGVANRSRREACTKPRHVSIRSPISPQAGSETLKEEGKGLQAKKQ